MHKFTSICFAGPNSNLNTVCRCWSDAHLPNGGGGAVAVTCFGQFVQLMFYVFYNVVSSVVDNGLRRREKQ